MIFDPPLVQAKLLRRYKRFLADVILATGEHCTVHCPNTGSMRNCLIEGSPCYLSESTNPKRKYRYTWELASVPGGHLACINTQRANALVAEGIADGRVKELSGFDVCARERKYGKERSRIDLLLSGQRGDCYVEVKSVTLAEGETAGFFPDAVSRRGQKHLRELQAIAQQGCRAVLFFCIQHSGIESVAPAAHIDPAYAAQLREAVSAGVELLAYRTAISLQGLELTDSVPVVLESGAAHGG